MPRSGHAEGLKYGSELGSQVGYRLAGVHPSTSLSQARAEAQIDYRLGDQSMDSRAVWFLGSGSTAEHLAYRPGERVTAADGRIIRDAMFGLDRVTGEPVMVRTIRNPHARVSARPYFTVIEEACRAAGVDPLCLHSGRNLQRQMDALVGQAKRGGTVVFNTAESLLRSNEATWKAYEDAILRGHDIPAPVVRFDRDQVLGGLGVWQRARQEDGTYDGTVFALDGDDRVLGARVHDAIRADSEILVPSGNAGYEVTLTCPKSLSLAAFLAPEESREWWMELVRDAARDAIDDLMARIGHGRTGHEGGGSSTRLIRGLGYAATVSIEAHSRELDPHLHGHVMIPNRVICVDGKERTLGTGGSDMVNHAWWVQAQFERRLRQLSMERELVSGWDFDLVSLQWEVAGADPEILEFYSQARAKVQAAVRDDLDGLGTPVSDRELRLMDVRAKRKVTASKTDAVLSWREVRDLAHARAAAAGVDLTTAFARELPAAGTQPQDWSTDVWARTVEETVCHTKAAEITARIDAAVRCWAPHDWDDDRVTQMLTDVKAAEFTPGVVRGRGRIASRLNASNRVARAEAQAMQAQAAGIDANAHRLTTEQVETGLALFMAESGWAESGRELTPGQRALFDQMTTGTDRVTTVVGAAGSGKTTALDAARVALADAGQNVYGICVAAIAAQQLRDASRIQAGTVTWLVARIEFARNPAHPARAEAESLARSPHRAHHAKADAIRARYAIPAMDHLVIDEASMIGAPDLATVLGWATDNDVTVTLIGDVKQLQPVGPSAMFTALHAAHPGVELTENLRQKTDLGRDCARFLRDGNPQEAFSLLAEAGRFIVATSQTQAEQILVEQWAEHAAAAPDARSRVHGIAIESDRNDQVDALNARARQVARERGWLTGEDVTLSAKSQAVTYAVGDQILITRNIARGKDGPLANGTRGVVTAITDTRVELEYWDDHGDRHDSITHTQAVRNARHGYAMTTHKLQGQTVSSLVVDVGPERDMSSAYVAFTRHTDDVVAVVNVCDIADAPEVQYLLGMDSAARTDAVVDMLGKSLQDRGFAAPRTAQEVIGRSPYELQPGVMLEAPRI